MKSILLTIFAIALCSSCSMSRSIPNACYDGWKQNSSGSSKLWHPSQSIIESIKSVLPEKREVHCYHLMPSNKIIVINSKKMTYATTLENVNGNYIVKNEGAIFNIH